MHLDAGCYSAWLSGRQVVERATVANADEAIASRVIAKALRAEGVERVHVAVIGLAVAHFHQHLYPRYPGVPPGWTLTDYRMPRTAD